MHEKRWEFPLNRENGGRRNMGGMGPKKVEKGRQCLFPPSLLDWWKGNSCMRWKNGGRERTKGDNVLLYL